MLTDILHTRFLPGSFLTTLLGETIYKSAQRRMLDSRSWDVLHLRYIITGLIKVICAPIPLRQLLHRYSYFALDFCITITNSVLWCLRRKVTDKRESGRTQGSASCNEPTVLGNNSRIYAWKKKKKQYSKKKAAILSHSRLHSELPCRHNNTSPPTLKLLSTPTPFLAASEIHRGTLKYMIQIDLPSTCCPPECLFQLRNITKAHSSSSPPAFWQKQSDEA